MLWVARLVVQGAIDPPLKPYAATATPNAPSAQDVECASAMWDVRGVYCAIPISSISGARVVPNSPMNAAVSSGPVPIGT